VRTALIPFIFLASVSLSAQVSYRGVPYIRNFAPETYRGSEQNWAIVQDSTGVMYFGNNDFGILVYDGVRWEQIALPENPIVRSLHIHRDVIYAGGVNEFGYLTTDPDGKMTYRSLSSQIPANDRPFADVWKIYSIGNRVYFSCELDRLFVFENLKHVKTVALPHASLFTFPVNGKVVAGTHLEGLMTLENDTFLTMPGGDFFAYKPVLSILPWEGSWWQVGTYSEGVFLYHPETGEISHRFPSPEANRYLKEHSLYHAISLPGNHTAYATLEGGALIID